MLRIFQRLVSNAAVRSTPSIAVRSLSDAASMAEDDGADLASMPIRRKKPYDRRSKERDRRTPITWEESERYILSDDFKDTYGEYKVHEMYRRNFGAEFHRVPLRTRLTCVKDGFIIGKNPCPICRDKYLVLHYKNVLLLKQFIDPFTGEVMSNRRVNLCQVKYDDLLLALFQAKDYGTISFSLPFKRYDYEEYYHFKLLDGLQLGNDSETVEDTVLKRVHLIPNYVDHEPSVTTFPNILPPKFINE